MSPHMSHQRNICGLCSWWYHASCATSKVNNNPVVHLVKYHDTVEFVPPIHRGIVVKIYDGDTITVATPLDVDWRRYWSCGKPPTLYRFRVRLRGIDSPEIKGSSEEEKAKAVVSRDALSAQILGQEVELRNVGNEKYGRVLADVYFRKVHMNQWMLEQGYARPYDGGTKLPFV